jgi:hypothetical protein
MVKPKAPVSYPADARHFESSEEMTAYIEAFIRSEEDTYCFLEERRSSGNVGSQDIMRPNGRLPGSGWSNLRRS